MKMKTTAILKTDNPEKPFYKHHQLKLRDADLGHPLHLPAAYMSA